MYQINFILLIFKYKKNVLIKFKVLTMVLKTGPGREPEMRVVPVLVVRPGGRTGDVINNLINNFKII